jgi:hypothetical protein
MMVQGLQNLINFRDDLQQEMPEPTGLDKLSLLQNLTMNNMADNAANNQLMLNPQQYLSSGGLISLPVVQALGGGFLKAITSPFRAVGKGISRAVKGVTKGARNIAKSNIGRIAIPLLLSYYAGPLAKGLGLGKGLGAKALVFGGGTGLTSLVAGDDPEEAFRKGAVAGGLYYGGGKLFGPKAGAGADKAIPAGQTTAAGTGGASSAYTGGASDLTGLSYGQSYAQPSMVGDVAAQQAAGVGTSNIPGFTGDIGSATYGGVGEAQAASSALQTPVDIVSPVQDPGTMQYPGGKPTISTEQPTGIIDTIKNIGGSAIDRAGEAIRAGYDKFAALSPGKKALVGGGALLGLSALSAGQQIPQQQLDMAGLTPVETDFDKQIFTYRDMQGNILDRDQALQMIQTASQSFGEGGEKVASGVTYGFDRVDDDKVLGASPKTLAQTVGQSLFGKSGGMVDPVLSASGGLIGMSYGGQMPMNNLDVKYKEFSGMVGGQGDGMEDNVYMPIVERDNGQQVATLAVSPKEYVVDANTMSLLGNGNPDAGAKIMDQTVKDIRMAATGQTEQQKEIDGLEALNRMRRSV